MKIRNYQIDDTEQIIKLFYDTLHEVNIRDYSQAQVNAWTGDHSDRPQWEIRLTNKLTYVAEKQGKIIGFGQEVQLRGEKFLNFVMEKPL